MKQGYPETTTWPYILVVAALLSFVIGFPSLPTLRSKHQFVEMKTALGSPSDRMKFADSRQRQIASAASRRLPSAPIAAIGSDPTLSTAPTETLGVAWTRDESSPDRSPDTQVDVWTPPANWRPGLIQSLSSSHDVVRIAIPADPPVANRVTRVHDSIESLPWPHDANDDGARRAMPVTKYASESSFSESTEAEFRTDTSPDEDVPVYTESPINMAPLVEPLNDAAVNSPDLAQSEAAKFHLGEWPAPMQLQRLIESAPPGSHVSEWLAPLRDHLRLVQGQPLDDPTAANAIQLMRRFQQPPAEADDWPFADQQLANRVAYSVQRRISVWQGVLSMVPFVSRGYDQALALLEAEVSRLLADFPLQSSSESWIAYLNLRPLLAGLASQEPTGDLAEVTLRRMYRDDLTPDQRTVFRTAPFVRLEQRLKYLIASATPPASFLASVERYESESTPAHELDIINHLRRWRSSPEAEPYSRLINAVDTHYRNANLRIAISEDLINGLVPAIHRYAEQVSDTILGAEVRGHNSTATNVSVDLIPDPQRIHLRFLANGQVDSDTSSNVGLVTMYNRSRSTFHADKQLIVDQHSIRMLEAQADAQPGTKLVGLQTALDNIPILGWVARQVAMQRHDESGPQMRAEIRRRIQKSATQRMDREVSQRLRGVEQRVTERIIDPLEDLGLQPRATELRTTQDRLIVRTRIASPAQFAAHSPRPLARADSLLSFQVHQSAVNNLIAQLQFGTDRMTLRELVNSVSEKLGMELEVDLETHGDVSLQFADDNPVEFSFDNEQVGMSLHLKELDNGERVWRDLTVRGCYRADINRLNIEFVRDDGIELVGHNLRLRDQVALRSIFTKVMARNHRLGVLRDSLAKQPKLQNLELNQVVLRDGWLAIAVGETRPAERLAQEAPSESNSKQPAKKR